MGKGGWHLSSKTLCVICHQPIKRTKTQVDSYAEPSWLSGPAHFRCVYPEMATTNGEAKQ